MHLDFEISIKDKIIYGCNRKLQCLTDYKVSKRRVWLKSILGRNNIIEPNIIGWETGIICSALLDTSYDHYVEIINFYEKLLKYQNWDISIFYMPDSFLHTASICKVIAKEKKYDLLPLVSEALLFCNNYKIEIENGLYLIPYRGRALYLDQIGIMGEAAQILSDFYEDDTLLNILLTQIEFTIDNQILGSNIFPTHKYELMEDKPIGRCTWGRGVGWWMMGVIYAAKAKKTPEDTRKRLIKYLVECSIYLISTQDSRGYLYDDIYLKQHIDTSTTALEVRIAFFENVILYVPG